MWVLFNDAALSIVAHRDKPEMLLVRGRFEGDIERVFPQAEVRTTPGADYRFRAEVARSDVAAALAGRAERIDYPNFKGSVADRFRHDVYLKVWRVLEAAQRAMFG